MKHFRKFALVLSIVLITQNIFGQGWSFNPADYSNTGEVDAIVLRGTTEVTTGTLGVFVGATCRGYVNGAFFPPTGKTVFTLICYSNTVGETLTFKYFDPGTSTTYDIGETEVFAINMQLGNAMTPLQFHTVPLVYSVTGGGSYCQGDPGLPVGLSDSESGVTYELIKNGSGTGSTLPGTGAAISFGNQLFGTYTIRGTSSGGTILMSGNAVISESPLPGTPGSISGTASVCQGQSSISYSVGAITNATSYIWAYSGTGATITGSTNSVTISFASNATTGNLTVRGANACGNGPLSSNYHITVSSLPVAAGTINGNATVCQGQSTVSYSVPLITGATSYTWAYSGIGETITGTTNSVTISFAANATSGNLTVYGVNTCGNGAISANYPITVNPLPSAAGAISGTATVCQTQSSVGYSTGVISNATSYTWAYSGTGATITGSTNSVTISFASNATSGNLTVRGTNSCGNGVISSNYPITVNPLPVAAGSISGSGSVCQGQSTVSYSVGSITNASSYVWAYSGTGATITGSTNSVTISFASNATSGNLTVHGNNSCGNGTVSPNFAITVNTLPGAAGTISGSATVCQGQATVSYSVPLISGATSYAWSYSGIGETITGTTNSVTISFAANATSGILTVLGVNACGNGVVSANYPITVNLLPSAAGAISGTATVCQTQSTVGYSVGVIANASSYTWAYSGTGATITGSTNSVTISFASNATSGNLTVRGTNSCGNGVISSNYPITVNPLPVAAGSISGSGSVCQGQSTVSYSVGSITNASSYIWAYSGTGATITGSTNSVTISFASNATSGNLTVRGSNACGSGTVSPNFAITVNTLPVAAGTITGSPAVCQGQSTVSYSVPSITGATSYTWAYSGIGETITGTTNSVTISFAANATAGNLTVQGVNACGNGIVSANYPITVNPLPSAAGAISGTASVCQGQSTVSYSTGAITNATSYLWAYTGTGATITGSTNSVTISFAANATSGNITVRGVNACGNGVISANYPVVVNLLPVIPAQTASISSGSTFNVTPTGGVIPAGTLYTWTAPVMNGGITGGVAQAVPQSTISGTLSIPSGSSTAVYTVTPRNGTCTGATFTVTVTVTSTCVAVTITTQPGNSIVCAISGNATFSVVASGTGPFTYQWQYFNGSTWGSVANGLPAGAVYTNAATATMNVTGITAAAVYQYRCHITNCSGGNFIDSNAGTLTINAQPVPTLTSSDADNIFCFGTSVTFTAGGGGAGATYDFRVNGATAQTGPLNTFTRTTLANAQVVSVVITNTSLCSATSTGIANFVNQPPYIISGPTATCSTDFLTYSVVLAVSTGTVTSTAGIVANAGGNNWTITGITAGVNITITITDINGCITTQPLTAPNCLCPVLLPPGSGGDRAYCTGGVIPTLSATVAAGGNPKTVDWYNSPSGGTPLLSGSLTYTPTVAGTYYALTREIVSNCVSSTRTPIVLTMNPLPIPTLTSSDADNIFCSGTSVIFTATGGTSYNFFVGGLSQQNSALATYTTSTLTNGQAVSVIVTNANGCIANSASITNTVNPAPTPTLTSSDADNTFCAGTSITFTATGGSSYDFRIGGISVQNGATATYTTTLLTNGQVVSVVVSNANGCTASPPSITNTVNPTPTPSLTSSDADNIFCAGTSVIFTASGGTNYNFRVGGISAQNGASTTFTTSSLTTGQVVDVIVSNSIGCAVTSTGITNTVNPQPNANAGTGGNTCNLSFRFSAVPSIGLGTWTRTSGPGTASFAPNANTANATVTVSEYGSYTFTWTELNDPCSSSSVISVNFYLQPTANAGTGGNNCGLGFRLNGSLNAGIGTWAKVSGPGNVSFSPDANTANGLVTVTSFGTYTFSWTVVNGNCSNSANVTVVFIQQAAANAGSDGSECDLDFVLKALVPGTGQGTWTKSIGPGNAVFTPDNHQANATVTVDKFGSYDFTWTVVNSTCSSSDVARVVFHDLPPINAGRDTVLCKGNNVQLKATGAGTVSWIPAALLNNPDIINPVATPDVTTTFTVNLTDQYGCKNSDNVDVEVRDKLIANAGPDQILGYEFTSTMDAQLEHSYEAGIWSVLSGTGEFLDISNAKTPVSNLSAGPNEFLWSVTNGFCPVSHDTVMIEVTNFLIPTLITPNLDGRNDYFVLRGLSTLGKAELIIFDRRGAQVYKNLNYDNSWDGVDYNKNPLPDDTYFFVLKTTNGKSISGYIVIRR
jgi:gliding motility-associated-like protein